MCGFCLKVSKESTGSLGLSKGPLLLNLLITPDPGKSIEIPGRTLMKPFKDTNLDSVHVLNLDCFTTPTP